MTQVKKGIYTIGGTIEKEDATHATINKHLSRIRRGTALVSSVGSGVNIATFPVGAPLGQNGFPTWANSTIVVDSTMTEITIALPSAGQLHLGDTYVIQRGPGTNSILVRGDKANTTFVDGTLTDGSQVHVNQSVGIASLGSDPGLGNPVFGDFIQIQYIVNNNGSALFALQGSAGTWTDVSLALP